MAETTGRVWGGMTSEQRAQRRRAQLVEAGLDVFAERGWAGATVLDICRRAGLSQRYFYEHFAGREALLAAVVQDIADEVQRRVLAAAAAPGRTPPERADDVLRALAGYFADDPRTIRVALVETMATPEFRAQRTALLAAFTDLAARLMASLAPDPARADARSLRLSAMVLSGGVAEVLISSMAGELPATPDELVVHLRRLYTAAAAL